MDILIALSAAVGGILLARESRAPSAPLGIALAVGGALAVARALDPPSKHRPVVDPDAAPTLYT